MTAQFYPRYSGLANGCETRVMMFVTPSDPHSPAAMQINPPFGYSKIVPLYRNSRVRLPQPGQLPPFVTQTNAVPITYTEFAAAGRDYPLVFISTDQEKTFSPVALIGIAGDENLFVKNGAWAPNVYIPAYVRRYPFCMARVTLDAQEQADRLTCVEKDFLPDNEGEGELMFDESGNALPAWQPIAQLLEEYERDLERTREMSNILRDYALFEPFTLQATLKDSGPLNLTGMYRIDEHKLESLNAAQLRNLMKKGILGRIYAHLISIDGFGHLLARKAGTLGD
jgi:hypothetical protein